MPTYQYRCTECGHEFEQVQSFSDDALTHCPQCEGRLRKVFNAVGVVFKGSGFYRTDSRSGASSTAPAASGSSGGATSTGSSDGGSGSSSTSGTSSSSGSSSSGSSGSSSSSSGSGQSSSTGTSKS